jgi:hypothetical protein
MAESNSDQLLKLYYELDKKQALLTQSVASIDLTQSELAQSVKDLSAAVAKLSVVTQKDFVIYGKAVDKRFHDIEEKYSALESQLQSLQRNTSFWVKFKERVGDRGMDILVTITITAILFFLFSTVGKSGLGNLFGVIS